MLKIPEDPWIFISAMFCVAMKSIVLQLDGTRPLYQQIYRALRKEILAASLAPGERVPSTRALAELLKVQAW